MRLLSLLKSSTRYLLARIKRDWRWGLIVRPRDWQRPRGVARGVARTPPKSRRSRRLAAEFKRGIDEVFDVVAPGRLKPSAARSLARMPEVHAAFGERMLEFCERFLGERPQYPGFEHYDVASLNNIDLAFLAHVTDDDSGERIPEAESWVVYHFKEVGLRTLRGRSALTAGKVVKPFTPPGRKQRVFVPYRRDCMARMRRVVERNLVFKDGSKSFALRHVLLSPDGVGWATLYPSGALVEDVDMERVCRAAYMIAWAREFLWAVVVEKNSLRLAFHCTPANVQELLWLRDAHAGRRAALTHLVSGHERRLASGKLVRVRPHLRGSSSCAWGDWRVTITPSAHDQLVLSQRMMPNEDIRSFFDRNIDLLHDASRPEEEQEGERAASR